MPAETARASFVIVAIEGDAVRALDASDFTERQRAALAHIVRHRGVDPLPPTPEPQPSPPPRPVDSPSDAIRRAAMAEAARGQGFSGDLCDRCGSGQMRRSGTCLICQACGSTTGCS